MIRGDISDALSCLIKCSFPPLLAVECTSAQRHTAVAALLQSAHMFCLTVLWFFLYQSCEVPKSLRHRRHKRPHSNNKRLWGTDPQIYRHFINSRIYNRTRNPSSFPLKSTPANSKHIRRVEGGGRGGVLRWASRHVATAQFSPLWRKRIDSLEAVGQMITCDDSAELAPYCHSDLWPPPALLFGFTHALRATNRSVILTVEFSIAPPSVEWRRSHVPSEE